MKVFGRKILDNHREQYELDVDDIVFEHNGMEIVVSLYRARTNERLEIRGNDGVLIVLPRAANSIEIETRR